jgi:hypothetical protein
LCWHTRPSMVCTCGITGEHSRRLLKRPDFSPAQPRRAETRRSAGKAAANYHFIRGGWDDPDCAQYSTHPALSAPRRALSRARAFQFPIPPLGEWPRLPSTARVNNPSKLARFSSHGMAPVLVPLRPSSEHILIVRAPGARDRHGCHSIHFHRARSASKEGTWPLPPHPSEAARCASKGIVLAAPLLFQQPARFLSLNLGIIAPNLSIHKRSTHG